MARIGVTTLGVIACLPRPLRRGRWDAAWHDRKEWRALVITSRQVGMVFGSASDQIHPPIDLFTHLQCYPLFIEHKSPRQARCAEWRSSAARFSERGIFFSPLFTTKSHFSSSDRPSSEACYSKIHTVLGSTHCKRYVH
jgi:hypothetical protein